MINIYHCASSSAASHLYSGTGTVDSRFWQYEEHTHGLDTVTKVDNSETNFHENSIVILKPEPLGNWSTFNRL